MGNLVQVGKPAKAPRPINTYQVKLEGDTTVVEI